MKKLLSAILAVSMLCLLMGCSQNTPAASSTPAPAASASVPQTEPTQSEPEQADASASAAAAAVGLPAALADAIHIGVLMKKPLPTRSARRASSPAPS